MKKWEKALGMVVGVILILGALYLIFSSYYKITVLEDEMKNTKLELGQLRSKVIESNQVNIDSLLRSALADDEKEVLKDRYDKIDSDWLQYIDGGKIQGKAIIDKRSKPVN